MGGGKQGEPPQYELLHKDMHAWMMTEDLLGLDIAGGGSGAFNPSTAVDGAAGAFNAARTSAIGETPYGAVGVFDPESPGNRYDVMLEETDQYIEFVQESLPETKFPDHVTAIKEKIDLDYDSDKFTDDVADFNIEQDIQRTADLLRKDDIISFLGESAVTSRSFMSFLLDEERDRASDGFSVRLHYEHQVDRRNLTLENALETIDQDNIFLAVRSQAINTLIASTHLYGKASRQALEDELRLAVEDILWDSKLVDFMNKSLGSITGVSIVPQGASGSNSTLNTISTVAGILGTLASVAI